MTDRQGILAQAWAKAKQRMHSCRCEECSDEATQKVKNCLFLGLSRRQINLPPRNDVNHEGFFPHFERKTLNLFSHSAVKLAAFTLAEVLIVLGIIGIIAEMTIPDLIQNTQNAERITMYKKMYSEISNAYELIKMDNGGVISTAYTDGDTLRDAFLAKISSIKTCEATDEKGSCWPSNGGYIYSSNTQYTNDGWWFDATSSSAILKNGVSLLFDASTVFNCNNSAAQFPECGRVYIDVNGLNNPNKLGKDQFWLFLYSDRVKPYGDGTTCGVVNAGWDCSSYYLLNNK